MSAFLKKKRWSLVCTRESVREVCRRVAGEVSTCGFLIWVHGKVGAGKTFWVNTFFHHLGLSAEVRVASPTYTYACEYELAGKLYNHCDLYRVRNVAQYRKLGIDAEIYHGGVYEWATSANCDDLPTHLLEISFVARDDERAYTFFDCRGHG